MSDQNQTLATSEMVDQFITIANELSKTQTKDRVATAFMFATARYNAFVSLGKSHDLAKDKQDALDWHTTEYNRMLESNMDELIGMQ
jgi:hypothetical protein